MSYYQEHECLPIIEKTSNLDFPAHLHKETEIGYLEKGASSVILDGKRYNLSEGDFFLIAPNSVHQFQDSKGLVCSFGIFSSIDVEELLKWRPVNPVVYAKDTPIKALMSMLTSEGEYNCRKFKVAIFAAVCSVFFKMTELESIPRQNDDVLKDILIYKQQFQSD